MKEAYRWLELEDQKQINLLTQTEQSWNPTKKSIIISRRKLIRRNVSDFYQPNKERFRSFCPKPFLIFTLVTTTIT